jgi:DNA-binding response OmpR family regulator
MCGPFARNGSERLDVVLARLRKKANEAFGPGIPIKNVHQVGYVFSAPAILD